MRITAILLMLALACGLGAMLTSCGEDPICPHATYTPAGSTAKCKFREDREHGLSEFTGCDDGRQYFTNQYSLEGSCP